MEDDGGIETTVVVKARSAYTWLDRLRFLKGLLPQEASVDFALCDSRCADLDVASLEETCKVLFHAKQKLGSKARKVCFMPKATEHILKEVARCTEDGGERAEDGSMNHRGLVEEDRFWTSGASERSDEAVVMSPKSAAMQRIAGDYSAFKRTARVTSFGTEPPARKTAVTRNRRSIADLGSNIAAKTQKLLKFEETRVVTQEHRQQRSGLKRRQSSEENGTTFGKNQRQPMCVMPEPGADQSSKKQPTQLVAELASDHPSKRPHESLVYITYQVFLKAGRGGLTAREAASRIEESGLGAVFQGLVKPRIKIGKIIRNNPYYFQAGEGRYILCEAIVGVTQVTPSPLPPADSIVQEKPQVKTADSRKEAAAMARREGTARYWAQMNANGRTRAPKSRHPKPGASRPKPPPAPVHWKSDESCVSTLKEGNGINGIISETNGTNGTSGTNGTHGTNGTNGTNGMIKWEDMAGKDEHDLAVVQANSKPRLKGMYKTDVGGKPCKRSDGKNWQCPLTAPANSNYCEHHQKRMGKDPTESKTVPCTREKTC